MQAPTRRKMLLSLLLAVSMGLNGVGALCAPADRIIVKYRDASAAHPGESLAGERLDRLGGLAGTRLTALRRMSGGAEVLMLPEAMSQSDLKAVAARLARDPDVLYAEPDRLMRPRFVPNDEFYAEQWSLFEDAGGARVQEAWDIERGVPEIVVALIDTGILDHEDLDPSRFVPGYDFISDPQMANDGDGRDADPADPGDAVAAGECEVGEPPQASTWHGTQISGIIGATTDNLIGIAGVTHGARLLMARVLGKCGGFTSDIVDAMRWAAGLSVPGVADNPQPARVINLSFGGEGSCSGIEQDAINDVNAAGAVVLVAAGNESTSASTLSPANCDGVVTVAATTRSGARASYTNTGPEVDISAPGGDDDSRENAVLTISNTGLDGQQDDDYAFLIGTSVATAHASGIAALVLSANDALSSAQVRGILRDTARRFPDASCTMFSCGSGIVDAQAAVQSALGTTADQDNGSDGGGGGGCTQIHHARTDPVDPLLPVLVAGAALVLLRRMRKAARRSR
jgi:serine protease